MAILDDSPGGGGYELEHGLLYTSYVLLVSLQNYFLRCLEMIGGGSV